MHDHRFPYLQTGMVFLLALTLSACTRSASSGMTPLPSLPPPTVTDTFVTTAPTTTVPASATASSEPTEEQLVTATPRTASATATQALSQASCGNALSTRLHLEGYAYVDPEPPLPNNLRSNAGQDQALLGDIQPGQAMKILEGPKCADGWWWWKVRALETELEGWTAEGDEQDYWLVPCTSESPCEP